MKASRTVCGKCGSRVIRADCFDGKARVFDLTPVAGADAIGHGHPSSRWWFTRSRGMVNGSLTDHGPSSWHVRHRCVPTPFSALPEALGARTGPTAGKVFAGCAIGYRWPAGPAHITETGLLGICGARLAYGETAREAARALSLAPCPTCWRRHDPATAPERTFPKPADPPARAPQAPPRPAYRSTPVPRHLHPMCP